MHKKLLWSALALGLFLRLLLIPNPGFEADVSFWKSWGLATVDFGVVEGMKVSNNNYPTPFAYTLGAIAWVYKLFADPHNFTQFWSNTNVVFLAVSKMLPILADFGIAAVLLYIGKHAKKLGFPSSPVALASFSLYDIGAIVYILSPISLMDGAWWGQVDSVGVVIFLVSLIFILLRMPFVGGLIFMLAMMTKLQNMIYGPLLFLFIWQTLGYRGLITAIAGAVTGFLGLNVEFIRARYMDRVIASLTENYDYFPWMSLMAYNPWWIISGGRGMQVSDKLAVVGIVNAKTVGLLTFSGFYLLAVLRLLKEKGLKSFLEGLMIVNGAFFLFQTQSHDRYAFPISVFFLLWAPFVVDKKNWKLFALVYSVFTLFYFYNLHTALVVNYPQNGLPILSLITQPFFTIATAIVLTGLFCLFVYYLCKNSPVTRKLVFSIAALIIAGIAMLNLPLLTKKPVHLSSFKPYISEQAYGQRQTNRAVQSSFGGPNKWVRLSVQYAFYEHGIGTHATSKHVFDINRKFSRFTTDFGIDTEAGTKATAVFEIYGDDKLLFRSDKMGRFDLPKHADVSVKGIRNLKLITTDAGDGNFDDHTDWLNPKLWP
jgi:Gpi18-like mannosyltransferase